MDLSSLLVVVQMSVAAKGCKEEEKDVSSARKARQGGDVRERGGE